MKWFGMAILFILGSTEGQNGANDPQCNIIAEEVLELKQPLITQLKKFAADGDFLNNWNDFFIDAHCLKYACEYYSYYVSSYLDDFLKLVKAFEIKKEIINATLNLTGIISSQELKLRQLEQRKENILLNYYFIYPYLKDPFLIFDSRFVDYDGLANSSRCEPCTDSNTFSKCLYSELNQIKEGLAIFQDVAVYREKLIRIINDTQDLLTKKFTNITLTNEQIFDFYKNTRLVRENKRFVDYAELLYGWYLRNTIKTSVNKFTYLVQAILNEIKQPINIQETCVGNVLKDVITQIKPYLTPIAKTLPAWSFDKLVSSYVQPKNETDINLIKIFEEGLLYYRYSILPRDNEYNSNYHNDIYNPYSNHISSIIYKGLTDLKLCPDFGMVYCNSVFRCFVDKGTKGEYAQAYVMNYINIYDEYGESSGGCKTLDDLNIA